MLFFFKFYSSYQCFLCTFFRPPRPTKPKEVVIEEDETSTKIFGRDALAELNEALFQLNNIQSGSGSGGLSFF